jgi:hypothetical protein
MRHAITLCSRMMRLLDWGRLLPLRCPARGNIGGLTSSMSLTKNLRMSAVQRRERGRGSSGVPPELAAIAAGVSQVWLSTCIDEDHWKMYSTENRHQFV